MKRAKHAQEPNTTGQLLRDLQALIAEAEALLADSVTEHSAEVVAALLERFRAAKERFAEAYAGARKRIIAGARCTDVAIRAHPYEALVIAGGVGLVLGILLVHRNQTGPQR